MKINFRFVIILIAFFLSMLCAYGFYAFWPQDLLLSSKHIAILVATFIITFFTIGSLGISVTSERTTFLIRTVAIVFFILGLISDILLAIFAKSQAPIIITIGMEFLIYLLIIYSLTKANQ